MVRIERAAAHRIAAPLACRPAPAQEHERDMPLVRALRHGRRSDLQLRHDRGRAAAPHSTGPATARRRAVRSRTAEQPLQRALHGQPAHGLPVAGEVFHGRVDGHDGPIPRAAQANHTVPTGFSGVPPVGSRNAADSDAEVPSEASRAPAAISRTVGSLTAPCRCNVRPDTPSNADLGLVGIRDGAAQEPA